MKQYAIKGLILLLALVLLVPAALCACSDKDDDNASGNKSTVSGTASEDKGLVPHLGDRDWGGRTLNVLAGKDDAAYTNTPWSTEEEESDRVVEAFRQRNDLLEETFGFTINAQFEGTFTSFVNRVQTDMISDTVDYDVVSSGLQDLAKLALEGYFLDLYSIPESHLQLSSDWWDVASNEDMTLAGKLFFTTGDLLIKDNEQTRCMYYNKDMIADYTLENPAQLVYDNKWTLDKMYEMAKQVAHDEDDGKMDVNGNDVWGLVGVTFDTYSLVMGCDAPQVERDETGMPYLAMLNQRNINAFDKAYQIMHDYNTTAYVEHYFAWNDPAGDAVKQHFYDGKALFLMELIGHVNGEQLRNANIRYGILPMPKYDESQETYATTINPYKFAAISILQSCRDTDFVTFALEALAYTSKQIVTPEYYDVTLKDKRFPDDNDSPEMLDILFSNRLVDISIVFDWGGCIQYYNQLVAQDSPQIASFVEGKRGVFEQAMNESINFLKALQ